MSIEAPTTYPYPPNRPPSNRWDHDTASWLLLEHADVAARFTLRTLWEHLRQQSRLMKHAPERVEEAAELARKYEVIQQSEDDPKIGKSVVRLYRTDPDRPRYPGGNVPAAARRD